MPPHRRIDAEGRPTVEDVAAGLSEQPVLLAVELRAPGEVVGYCGLLVGGHGSPDEPELA